MDKASFISQFAESMDSKPIQESVSPEVVIEKKIFEHRNELKKIREYSKIIKKDDEEWDDNDWTKYEAWKNRDTGSFMDAVSESVKLQESNTQKMLNERQNTLKAGVKLFDEKMFKRMA